jgi:hypothetical protein
MPRYCVNATKTVAAWLYVDADSPDDALEQARGSDARSFETDDGTAEVEFNVTPEVEAL